MKNLRLQVENAAPRLDRWLCGQLPDLSRTRIQALIAGGDIRCGGHPAKASQRLAAGDLITVELPDPAPMPELRAEAIPLAVLYEDADIIVIDKPAGLVVHPAVGHAAGTLVNALLHHCHDLAGIGGEVRPGIVHRLDRDTSGAMVVAKNEVAMHGLAAQFKAHTVHKEYLALAWGTPRPPAGTISTLIGRSERNRKKMSVRVACGRTAITTYTTLMVYGSASLIKVVIETGRTHQIRVHLAHIGHPIVGDSVYGLKRPPPLPAPALRQMLHAARLVFRHPRTGINLDFAAPVPADMAALLQALRDIAKSRVIPSTQ